MHNVNHKRTSHFIYPDNGTPYILETVGEMKEI